MACSKDSEKSITRADSKEDEPTRVECNSGIDHPSRLVQSQVLLDRTSEPTRRRESRLEQSKKVYTVHLSWLEEEGADSKHQASWLKGDRADSNITDRQKQLVFQPWILSHITPNGSILGLNGQIAWMKDKSFENQREEQSSHTTIEYPKEGELRGLIQAFKSIHCILKSWSHLLRSKKTSRSTQSSTPKSSFVLKLQYIRQLGLSFIVAYFL